MPSAWKGDGTPPRGTIKSQAESRVGQGRTRVSSVQETFPANSECRRSPREGVAGTGAQAEPGKGSRQSLYDDCQLGVDTGSVCEGVSRLN